MDKKIKRAKDFLSPQSFSLFQMIEETFDDHLRRDAIFQLGQSKNSDDARALMEAFELCLWRDTKKDLLRAIGANGSDRAIEFLVRFVEEHGDDLPLVQVAVEFLQTTPRRTSAWPPRKRAPLVEFFGDWKKDPRTPLSESQTIYALKWLAEETHPELTSFVEGELLRAEAYLPMILSIAAAKRHTSEASRGRLLGLLNHENPSIRGRAIDSLAPHLIQAEEASQFWCWFWEVRPTLHEQEFEKILVSMEPKLSWGDLLLADLRSRFQNLLSGSQGDGGVFRDENERDLSLRFLGKLYSLPRSRELAGAGSKVLAEVDRDLSESLAKYSQFSESIKSVLRNAELTWKHPELFVEGIDKSTMLIEWTKALDLSLKEAFLDFFLGHKATPHKLQSHLMRMNLDRPRLPSAQVLIESLKCKGAFTPDVFPLHKMSVLCGAILSGKFFTDPERFIDGLRSWAILLLVFGRSLDGVKPLIPLAGLSLSEVNLFCKELNYLQDVRNRAVHRESAFPQEDLAQVRQDTFRLLGML